MKRLLFHLLILALLFPRWVLAHEIRHTVVRADAVVVTLAYADQTPFAFASYEVFRAGESAPFQTGKTDQQGRVTFLPDREGAWLVKAFTTDGHGLEVRLRTDRSSLAESENRPLVDRYPRLSMGLGVIFGLFGLAMLFYRRRR